MEHFFLTEGMEQSGSDEPNKIHQNLINYSVILLLSGRLPIIKKS
jgi:hypothetical protein